MKDEFSQAFFRWIEEERLRVPDVAADLNKEPQTVYNWRSKGVPKAQRVACQSLMERSREQKFEEIRSTLVLKPSHDQLNEWNKAALKAGKTIEDWAFEGLEEMAEEFFSAPDLGNLPSNVSTFDPDSQLVAEEKAGYHAKPKIEKPYEIPFLGAAAAGEQVEAPLDETIPVAKKYPDGYFAVRVNGRSMEPMFMDGEILVFEPKEYSPTKGAVHIITDGYGCSIKIYDGGKKAFVSHNPDFPDLIPAGEAKIQGKFIETLSED